MIWKVCPSYDNYEVSEYGHVRRVDNHAPLRGSLGRKGHRQYNISRNGRCKTVHAARLVLDAFVGPAPFDKAEACHNDGNPANDHYSNLRWGTRSDNHYDAIAHGTWDPRGCSKLTAANVVALRDAVKAGVLRKALCAEYGITKGRLSEIVNRKTWAHL